MNIFVAQLDYSVEDGELREVFEAYGEVSSARIITDRETGRSKGFGFVEMPDSESAQNAISELNGADLKGRALVAKEAEERKQNGGFNRQRRDNNRGYDRGNSRW